MHDPVPFAVPFFLLLLIIEWTAARKLDHAEDADRRPARVGRYHTPRCVGEHLDGPGVDRHHRGVQVPRAVGIRGAVRLRRALAPARHRVVHVGDRHPRCGPAVLLLPPDRPSGAADLGHASGPPLQPVLQLRHRAAAEVEQQRRDPAWIPCRCSACRRGWCSRASRSTSSTSSGCTPSASASSGGQSNSSSTRRRTTACTTAWTPSTSTRTTAGSSSCGTGCSAASSAETSRPHYGLTKPVDTFNIWTLQTHEYAAIARDVRRRAAVARPVRLRLRAARVGTAPRPERAPAPVAAASKRFRRDRRALRWRRRLRRRSLRNCGDRVRRPRRPRADRTFAGGQRFGSMWLDIQRPDTPRLSASVACDLLVVGGGYTGLWTALHAAQRNPDPRIVLIEANRIGWAASGRNGGFVDASLTHGAENGKSRWPNEIRPARRDGHGEPRRHAGRDRATRARRRMAAHRHALGGHRAASGRVAAKRPPTQGEGRFLDRDRGARRGRLADLSGGAVQRRHLRDRPPGQAGARTRPRLPRRRRARSTNTPTRRAVRPTPAASLHHTGGDHHRRARPCWRPTCSPACCGATGCTPCPSTTTCWPPSRSPTHSWTASAGGNRQGIGDCANQFHYYRLTADNRIVWGGYDAIYHFGRRVDPAYEDRPADLSAAGRALLPHLPATRRRAVHPPVGRRRSTPTPGSARTGDWPATAGWPTSTGSPGSAWARPGSPPTCASTCSRARRRRAPSSRWCAAAAAVPA